MANMTPQEQLMLELINRARMDPVGEAKRFGIALNEGLQAGTISAKPKQVLAGNDAIADAADSHSKWMLSNDIFSHDEKAGTQGFTGRTPQDRMSDAGYKGALTSGENIAFRGTTQAINAQMQTQFILDQHEDLFVDKGIAGRGHRLNILESGFAEIGIGQQIGKFQTGGTNFNASMVTQDFAARGNGSFVTGVVYNDKVIKDDFFSVGEQTTSRSVTSDGAGSDKTGAGGGYELRFDGGGAKVVDFDLAGGRVTVGLTLGSSNAKVDVVNGKEVWSDTSITSVSGNVRELHALGIGKVDLKGADTAQAMFGNKAANVIAGNRGNDTIDGGGGKDELQGNGGADTFVFAKGDTGKTEKKADTISDFTPGKGDRIDLSGWDADSNIGGRQDFTFIGSQGFHGKAGELHFRKQASDTWIEGDTNGDRKADFIIHLDDAVTLKADHFDF